MLGLQEILGCGGRKGDRYGHMKECWSSKPETSFDPALPRTFLCDLRPPRPLLWASCPPQFTCWTGLAVFPFVRARVKETGSGPTCPKALQSPAQVTKFRPGPRRAGLPPGASRTHDPLCLWDLMRHKIRRGNSGCCTAANLAELLIPSLA